MEKYRVCDKCGKVINIRKWRRHKKRCGIEPLPKGVRRR